MKILHLLDHSVPLHSGYSFRTLSILREQRARGWSTAHLTTSRHNTGTALEDEAEGLRFHRTPAAPGLFGNLPVLKEIDFVRQTARRLAEVARQERPDLIHAHSPVLTALAALRVGRLMKLPVVYEIRAFWEDASVDLGTSKEGDLRYRTTRALETWAMRRVDAVTTICEGLRADIAARGIPADKVTVIPNAVDTATFQFMAPRDAELAARLDLAGRTVIGFIGSFYAYEGLDLLVEALAAVRRSRADVALLLVGGGPMREAVEAQVKRLGLADAVRLIGRVPHDEVQSYYSLVDVFAYPRHSQRLTELVTPLKPLEAMARGGIVLASDVGGHRELVRDRDTGILFKADDAGRLAASMLELLSHPERWPDMRQAARRFVERERTWARSVQGYERAYARALGRPVGSVSGPSLAPQRT